MSDEQGRLWSESRHRRRGVSTRALGTTVAAMRTAGMLEPIDEACVVECRVSAGVLDAAIVDPDESRFVIARLLAEHRANLLLLRSLAPVGGDALDDLLRELSAPVGDTPDP